MNLGLFLLWLIIGHLVVTLVKLGHVRYNEKVKKMDTQTKGEISSAYDNVAFFKTIPYHPLYNIIIWPIITYIYLTQLHPANLLGVGFYLGTRWVLISIVIDLIGWVIIKHPLRFSIRDMYVEYLPYLILIYFIIFISPFIAEIFI